MSNYSYCKVSARNALAISRVSFAGVLVVKDGKIANIACAFGAVADTVLRFKDIEKQLVGKTIAETAAAGLFKFLCVKYCSNKGPRKHRISQSGMHEFAWRLSGKKQYLTLHRKLPQH